MTMTWRDQVAWQGAKLPSGEITYDPDLYTLLWHQLIDDFCEPLGLNCIGFDPGLLVEYKDRPGKGAFSIEVHLAQRVVTALNNKEKTDA